MKMERTKKRYGQTFLTKPRWFTDEYFKANNSMFVWGTHGGSYSLSLLGVLNGLLGLVNLVLVAHIDKDSRLITNWELRKVKK